MSDGGYGATVFTRVFVGRLLIGVISAGLTSFLIAFAVADYVVKANTASNAAAFQSLQTSLELLNANVIENTSVLSTIRDEIADLSEEAATQGTNISFIRRDLEKVQTAVQGAGIAIPAIGAVDGGVVINTSKWRELQEIFGATGDEPIFIEVKEPDFQ
jgi:hypothetical protein